jgi:hypothetical protein
VNKGYVAEALQPTVVTLESAPFAVACKWGSIIPKANRGAVNLYLNITPLRKFFAPDRNHMEQVKLITPIAIHQRNTLYIQYLPKVFGSPKGPYAKKLFLLSSKYYSF